MSKSSQHSNQEDEEILAIVQVMMARISINRVEDDDEMFIAILTWMASREAVARFKSYIENLLMSGIESQVELYNQILQSEVTAQEIAALWMRRLDEHIGFINATTTASIRQAIANGIANGENISGIANRIVDVFDRAADARAAMIARTEVLSAFNFTSQQIFEKLGVPYKRWSTILDGLERDTHNEANNQLVRVSEPFDVGGYQLMYPGDPSAPNKERINCRCSMLPEFEADRSMWGNVDMAAFNQSLLTRQTNLEASFENAVRVAFQDQQGYVRSIINLYLS